MKIIINGAFPGLNEFISANRKRAGNWSCGNDMKKHEQNRVAYQLPRWHTERPVYIRYVFYCKNRKMDKDNIAGFFHKIFQDALVARGCIPNDGWNNITGFSDTFYVDPKAPRVEVEIVET